MPLQKVTRDFPFLAGPRQDKEAALLQAVLPDGLIARLENRRYTKDGRLARRFGFASVPLTDTAGNAITDKIVRLTSLGSERVVIGKANVWTQLPETPSDRWANRGYHPRCGNIVRRHIQKKADEAQMFPAVAYANGLRVYAWIDAPPGAGGVSGDAWVRVVDNTTGGTVFEEILQTNNATCTRALAVGPLLYVFWIDESTTPDSLKAVSIDTTDTTPTAITSTVTISTDVVAVGAGVSAHRYDVDTMNGDVYVAFHASAGGSQRVERRTGNTSLTLVANTTTTDSSASPGINSSMAIYCEPAGGGGVWVGYGEPSIPRIRACHFNAALGVRNGPFTLDGTVATRRIAVGRKNDTTAIFYYFRAGTTSGFAWFATGIQTCTTGGTVGSQLSFYHVMPASKPFDFESRQYVVFQTFSTEFQSIYALCDVRIDVQGDGITHIPQPEAYFGQGEASAFAFLFGMPQEAPAMVTSGEFLFSGQSVHDIVWDGADIGGELTGVADWPLSFIDARRFLPEANKESLVWSGGLPTAFDGNLAHEVGFAYAVESVTTADSASGGALLAESAYTYFFVFEWYDKKGQRHLSRPGPLEGVTHTTGVGVTAIDLRIQTLTLTNRDRQNASPALLDEGTLVRILVYRNDVDGTIWHLVQQFMVSMPNNDTTTHSVAFTDTVDFSAAERNEVLYTTDGSLMNDAPGPLAQVKRHRDRLFGINGDSLYWTKRLTPNGRAPEWSSLFSMKVEPGTVLTAIESFDAVLVIFTADRVYVLGGDGPEDDGSGQIYPPPDLLPSDVGCIEPRSTVLMREGLCFQSKRGIELLPRGGSAPLPIGEVIRDDTAEYRVITSALVVPEQTQLRLAGNAPSGASFREHRQLCWDYSIPNGGAWSVNGFANGSTTNVSAVLWDDKYTFALNDDTVIYQETTTWADAGAWIVGHVETGDFRLGGLNGFGRIYETILMGEHRDKAKLTIEASYDRGKTWTTPVPTWDFTAPTAGAELVASHQNRIQRGTMMRLRIKDAQATGGNVDSEGHVLNAVSLVYGRAAGARRVQESLRR